MNRRILLTLLVIITAVCLVLSIVSVLGAGIIIWKPELLSIVSVAGESTPTQSPISKPDDPGVDITTTPESTSMNEGPENDHEPIPPQVLVEMELIQRQVIQDRGLEASGVFTRVLFTRDQLSQRVLNDFLDDYTAEEASEDTIVLEAFGLLNSDFDMYNFYLDLLSEQVAGFYDNETKEMVVVQDTAFGGSERLTYSHEYTHALQDQNFDIKNGLKYYKDICEDNSERCAAIQALLEGDATLSELNWYQNHATTKDQSDILSSLDSYDLRQISLRKISSSHTNSDMSSSITFIIEVDGVLWTRFMKTFPFQLNKFYILRDIRTTDQKQFLCRIYVQA